MDDLDSRFSTFRLKARIVALGSVENALVGSPGRLAPMGFVLAGREGVANANCRSPPILRRRNSNSQRNPGDGAMDDLA